MKKKESIKKIKQQITRKINEGAAGRKPRIWLFRKDFAAMKYLTRCAAREDFVLTKRTIAELSPWNIQMIKTILKKDIVDISSGLKELLKRGATAQEIQQAFQNSIIFNRLANMNYYGD